MRFFKRKNLKRFLLALTILSIVPLNYAQVSKTDSLTKDKPMKKPNKTESAKTSAGTMHKPTDSLHTKKDSVDISRCFENGFLFKQSSLSNI